MDHGRSQIHFTYSTGASAVEIYPMNVQNTVFDIMRLIGRTFDELRDLAQQWPFKVTHHAGRAVVAICGRTDSCALITAEEILALILVDLYTTAQERFGIRSDEVRGTVLALPVHFSSHQKLSVIKAAELAGLTIVATTEEPIASAIAYRYDHASSASAEALDDVVVFNVGGVSLDVSIVKASGRVSSPELRFGNRFNPVLRFPF